MIKGAAAIAAGSPFSLVGPSGIDYPKMAFKSSSAVPMGLMSKFFTRVSSTLGVMNAGSYGPRRMPLIPK